MIYLALLVICQLDPYDSQMLLLIRVDFFAPQNRRACPALGEKKRKKRRTEVNQEMQRRKMKHVHKKGGGRFGI